jgi:hypothetical protein
MGMGNTSGAMVDATKDSTLMIKSMALGYTTGLMADDTRVTGSMENNTAKVLSFNQMAL